MKYHDIKWIDTLPPFRLLANIIRAFARIEKDISQQSLIHAIEQDPIVAARLVAIANSPFYSPQQSINTVSSSIMSIGLRDTKSILFRIILNERFPNTSKTFSTHHYWYDIMMMARMASLMAKKIATCASSADDLYTLGLLNSVGILLLVYQFPDEMEDILNSDDINAGISAIFGMDYHQIGARLLNHWGLPDTITRQIEQLTIKPGFSRETKILRDAKKLIKLIASKQHNDDEVVIRMNEHQVYSLKFYSEIHDEVVETLKLLH